MIKKSIGYSKIKINIDKEDIKKISSARRSSKVISIDNRKGDNEDYNNRIENRNEILGSAKNIMSKVSSPSNIRAKFNVASKKFNTTYKVSKG